jgi:threonylcarbamoyladenosine tRNA methylthiotransferase MtaB
VHSAMSKAMIGTLSTSKKKAAVHVLGCKVNQAEAAAITLLLEKHGYEVNGTARDPELIVVNTCCVTAKAEGKSRRAVGRLAERYPEAQVVVTGCLAEVNPSSLGGLSGRPVVLGTYEKDRFEDFLLRDPESRTEGAVRGASECVTFSDLGVQGIPGRARTFLKVQDGCSQECAYCIVPRARGPSRSLLPDRVVSHARRLEDRGYAEIVLTGVHLGSYGLDLDPPFGLEDLLERLLFECRSVRFRLSSIEPQDISSRLISLAADNPRVCRHFHIPLQSGDDEILARMGRPYDAAFMKKLASDIRHRIPDACIGFDVMVGFPGEDEQSFGKTEKFVRNSGAAYLHVFPYSPRPGTRAASFAPRVSEKVARRRVDELRTLSATMRRRFYEGFLGRTLIAIPESAVDAASGSVVARTDNYIPVRASGPAHLLRRSGFSVLLSEIEDLQVQGIVLEHPRE